MNGREPDILKSMRQDLVDNPILSRYIMQDKVTAELLKDPYGPLKKGLGIVSDFGAVSAGAKSGEDVITNLLSDDPNSPSYLSDTSGDGTGAGDRR